MNKPTADRPLGTDASTNFNFENIFQQKPLFQLFPNINEHQDTNKPFIMNQSSPYQLLTQPSLSHFANSRLLGAELRPKNGKSSLDYLSHT